MQRLAREDQAADATEYALVTALVALAIVVGAGLLGGDIAAGYDGLVSRLSAALPNL